MGKGNAKGNKRAPKYGRRATKRQTFFYQQLLLLRSLFPEIKNPSRNVWIFASVNNHVPRDHSAWAEWKLDACQEWVWQEEKEKNRDVIFYLSRIKEQSERESEDDILSRIHMHTFEFEIKIRCGKSEDDVGSSRFFFETGLGFGFTNDQRLDKKTVTFIQKIQKKPKTSRLQNNYARVMRVAVPIPAVASASVFHSAAGGGSVVDVVRPL